MKREIIFRGKRPNSGKWIEGYLFQSGGFSYILHKDHFTAPECACEVLTESVGQQWVINSSIKAFTGDLLSMECAPAFNRIEKRIVKISECDKGMEVLIWHNNEWHMACMLRFQTAMVVGNIHDNPELL